MAFPPNMPMAGGPPKPPSDASPPAGGPSPGAKAVRDAMVKALDEAMKDPEFCDSLETTGSVEFDVSADDIEIETDDVTIKGGAGDKPDASPDAAKPAAPPPFPPKG